MGLQSLSYNQPTPYAIDAIEAMVIHGEDEARYWIDQVVGSRLKAVRASISIFHDMARYVLHGIATSLDKRMITAEATDSWMRAGKYLILAITCLVLGIIAPRVVAWAHSTMGLANSLGTAIKVIKFAYRYRYLLTVAALVIGGSAWHWRQAISVEALFGAKDPTTAYVCVKLPGLPRFCLEGEKVNGGQASPK